MLVPKNGESLETDAPPNEEDLQLWQKISSIRMYKECTRSKVSKDGHMAKVSNKRPTLNSSHPPNMNAVFSTPCHGPLSTCTSPTSTMVSPLVSGAHLQEGRVAELLHRLLERGILRNLGRAPDERSRMGHGADQMRVI
jgi:hypothetical protein